MRNFIIKHACNGDASLYPTFINGFVLILSLFFLTVGGIFFYDFLSTSCAL